MTTMTYSLALCLSLPVIFASPVAIPQAVTDAIPPSEPPPPGCVGSFPGTFGIAVVNVTSTTAMQKRQLSPSAVVMHPISQIADGQIQAATAPATIMPTPGPSLMTVAQVNQIADGQVQGGMHTVTLQMMPTAGDARPTYMPAGMTSNSPSTPTAAAGSGISTPTAPTPTSNQTTSTSPSTASNSTSSSSPSQDVKLVSCRTNSALTLTLSDSILTDSLARTGYIASNYQFQFDNPPQSAALYTSGWSVCGNGSLALGGKTTFWQCLSGDFYNLYDRRWAAQCSEVEVRVVELVDC